MNISQRENLKLLIAGVIGGRITAFHNEQPVNLMETAERILRFAQIFSERDEEDYRDAFEIVWPEAQKMRNEYFAQGGHWGKIEYANDIWQNRYLGFKSGISTPKEVIYENHVIEEIIKTLRWARDVIAADIGNNNEDISIGAENIVRDIDKIFKKLADIRQNKGL